MTHALAAAYAECERITAEQARNFSWGIKLLPPVKRQALSAVYANARRIDDIGDGDEPVDRKLAALAQARIEMADPQRFPDDPRLLALADAARRLPIPLPALGELIDGCERDTVGHTYVDYEDLVGYCRLVAGSIGRLSLGVFGPAGTDRSADSHPADSQLADSDLADSLGVALQITNILRDIREDLLMGRTYLPKADLALFGIDEIVLTRDGALDPQGGRLAELIRFEAARAFGWYDTGRRLLPRLDRRSAACCAAMAGIYRQLLVRISREPSLVFDRRCSLPGTTKLRIAMRSLTTGRIA